MFKKKSKNQLSTFIFLLTTIVILSCGKESKIQFHIIEPTAYFLSDIIDSSASENEDINPVNDEYDGEGEEHITPNREVSGFQISPSVNMNLENNRYIISPLQINLSAEGTSVANLELLENSIPNGITILPEIAGIWRFKNENTLVFLPNVNWGAGVEYTVTMNPEIFQKGLIANKQVVKFKTSPFAAKVVSSALVRDIGEERTPRFVIAVEFTHAVDTASFEGAVKFQFDNADAKYTIKYDDAFRKAIIISDAVAITTDSRKFLFTAENFVTKDSKSKTSTSLRAVETVPDFGSIFFLKDTQYTIVRDKQNTPNQVIFLEFTDIIDNAVLDKNIELYIIPESKKDYKLDYHIKQKNDYKKVRVSRAVTDGLPEVIHAYNTDIGERDRLLIIVNKGFYSKSGFPLKTGLQQTYRPPSYPKEINIVSEGAILSLGGDKTLTYASRGISDLTVEIGKLVDYGRLYTLISGSYNGGIKTMEFYGSIDQYDYVDKIREEKFSYSVKSPKEVSYSGVNLGKYLQQNEAGIFFLSAKERNGGYDQYYNNASRIIMITDMGIIIKKNEKGASSIFVISLSNHSPVSNAKVEIIGRNGLPIFTTKTSDNGRADYPNLSEFKREKFPIAVVVSKGKDISFMPLDKYNNNVALSRFDIGGISDINNAIRAFIFTDRGIYRPGEKVNFATVVKQSDWKELDGVTVIAKLYDPQRGKPILIREFSLDKSGFFEFDYQTTNVMQTGLYSVEIYRKNSNRDIIFLGETFFKLEEFKPDTMKVKVDILGKVLNGWQMIEKVSARILVENLFGSSAVDRRVKWEAEIVPTTFRFKGFTEYTFTNPTVRNNSNNMHVFTPTIKDNKTDKNGESKTVLGLSSIGAGTFILTVVGESFEPESGDSVKGFDTAYISSLEYLVGYKSASNLNFIQRGAKATIELIAIDNNLNKINLINLKYKLKNISYVMSLVKTSNGVFTYQAVEKATMVADGNFTIHSIGSRYEIDTKDAGKYILEIYSKDNILISSTPYFISGSTNLETGVEKSAELSIQLDKNEYKAGEEITLNIIAPYIGSGLITIERDKIYAFKWFKTATSSTVQKITVPADLEGNAYINVSYLRNPESTDIFITPYSYGVVPFKINTDKRKINLSIKSQSNIAPGDELKIKYKLDKNADIILYGVDEGILQVSGYKLPNALEFFMTKRALSVSTMQTVDLVLPNYKVIKDMLATGGGESIINKRLNPFARKTLTPAVFWSSIKKVEAGKEYEFSYQTPDYFNGTLKIMAVAVNSSSIGAEEISILVKSPVVMIVNTPNAVTSGDKFNVTVSATNFIENSNREDIKISAKPSNNVEIIGDTSKTLSIDYKGEKTATFLVKVKENTAAASEIKFTAESAKISKPISVLGTFSVRPITRYNTTFNIGVSADNSFEIKKGFRDMYNELATRWVGVSTTSLISVFGLVDNIISYPHSCSEQIVSKVIPQLYLSQVINNETFKTTTATNHKNTIQELRKRSKAADGFKSWANSSEVNHEVSTYVAHYLADANSLGYPVPSDMLSDIIKYLGYNSMIEPKSLDDARLKSYMTYLLARYGVPISRQLNAVEEYLNSKHKNVWKTDLIAAYIGASYVLMKSETKGLDLMNGVKLNEGKTKSYSDYDGELIRKSIYVYLMSMHNNKDLAKINELKLEIIKQLADEKGMNTITTSRAVMALGRWSYIDPALMIVPKVTAIVADKNVDIKVESFASPERFPADVSKILVRYPDKKKTPAFYYIVQSGYDKLSPPATSNGIEILREFYDSKGVKTRTFKVGDIITVKVLVRITDKKIDHVNNLAITDILPGGIEVIQSGSKLGNNNDIREDRVIIYSSLLDNSKVVEFTYNAKALSVGDFVTPPIYAEDMYRLSVNGNSGVGKLIISDVE